MNKKLLGFSLVSSILVGSIGGVVSADWKERLNKLAEKDLEDGKEKTEKLENFKFDEELGATGKMKKAVKDAINAMQEYKQSYLNLKWHNKRSKNTEQEKYAEEALLKEIKEKEERANELIKNAEQLFEKTGLLNSVVFPWDDIEKKYSFLFRKQNDLDLDETNKENILKKLKFITENEEKSKFFDEYVNKTKKISELRKNLKFAQDYRNKDTVESLKKELIKVYSERQILNRKIMEEWVSKNKSIHFSKYPLIFYRDGNIPKNIIDDANRQIMECNDTLKEISEIKWEIKRKDNQKTEWINGNEVPDSVFVEMRENWFNKERLEKINRLMVLKEVLNSQKKYAEDLVSPYKIFLPWNKIDKKNGKWAFLFNLEKNEDLDKEYNLDKLYDYKTIIAHNSNTPGEPLAQEYSRRKLKDESRLGKLDADYKWYSNQIAFARQHLREDEERGEKNSTYWEQELVMFFQARQWAWDSLSGEIINNKLREESEEENEKEGCKCLRLDECNIF